MSALRVSRRAAEESDRIAAFQSLAAMAAFPAAYSGSSCPSFGASSVGSARVAPGSRARPKPSRPTEILTPITSLLVVLALGRPGLGAEDLDLDLAGPVTLARLLQRRPLLLQLLDVRLGRRGVTAAGGAHGPREVRDRLGHRIAGAERLQLRGALPVLAFEHVTGRHRRARRRPCQGSAEDLLDRHGVLDEAPGLDV